MSVASLPTAPLFLPPVGYGFALGSAHQKRRSRDLSILPPIGLRLRLDLLGKHRAPTWGQLELKKADHKDQPKGRSALRPPFLFVLVQDPHDRLDDLLLEVLRQLGPGPDDEVQLGGDFVCAPVHE